MLVNGEAARSCLMLAVQADGAELMTVEGLATAGRLHPLQEALREHHALPPLPSGYTLLEMPVPPRLGYT